MKPIEIWKICSPGEGSLCTVVLVETHVSSNSVNVANVKEGYKLVHAQGKADGLTTFRLCFR